MGNVTQSCSYQLNTSFRIGALTWEEKEKGFWFLIASSKNHGRHAKKNYSTSHLINGCVAPRMPFIWHLLHRVFQQLEPNHDIYVGSGLSPRLRCPRPIRPTVEPVIRPPCPPVQKRVAVGARPSLGGNRAGTPVRLQALLGGLP